MPELEEASNILKTEEPNPLLRKEYSKLFENVIERAFLETVSGEDVDEDTFLDEVMTKIQGYFDEINP